MFLGEVMRNQNMRGLQKECEAITKFRQENLGLANSASPNDIIVSIDGKPPIVYGKFEELMPILQAAFRSDPSRVDFAPLNLNAVKEVVVEKSKE